MKIADIPYKFPTPWANSAPGTNITNPIPTPPQTGGHASFTEGYPPINSTAIAAGGIPPWGTDTNGIHFAETSWLRWVQAGGPIKYDSTFSSDIGGYPNGAVVASALTAGLWWRSTVDDNTTDPDAGGANWVPYPTGVLIGRQLFTTAGAHVYTPTSAAVTTVDVTLQGGFGAGGGCTNTGVGQYAMGGGGSAGGIARYIGAVSVFSGLTCTLGSGGTSSVGGAGTSGTSSTFGPLTATGGGGGDGGNPALSGTAVAGSAPPGSGSGGNFYNGYGAEGTVAAASASTNFVAGAGGGSFLLPGAPYRSAAYTGQGLDGSLSAGGGAGLGPSSAGVRGGNGAAGICLILEYS